MYLYELYFPVSVFWPIDCDHYVTVFCVLYSMRSLVYSVCSVLLYCLGVLYNVCGFAV